MLDMARNEYFSEKSIPFPARHEAGSDIATKLIRMDGPRVIECAKGERNEGFYPGWQIRPDNFEKFLTDAHNQGAISAHKLNYRQAPNGMMGPSVIELLKGPGPFTLLVPVDSSVHRVVDAKAHILIGKYTLEDLAAGGSAQTLAGTSVEFSRPDKTSIKLWSASELRGASVNRSDHRTLGGVFNVSKAWPHDVECSNGVIHAIDAPLKVMSSVVQNHREFRPGHSMGAMGFRVGSGRMGGAQKRWPYRYNRGIARGHGYNPRLAGLSLKFQNPPTY
jgi:hypothetical protein